MLGCQHHYINEHDTLKYPTTQWDLTTKDTLYATLDTLYDALHTPYVPPDEKVRNCHVLVVCKLSCGVGVMCRYFLFLRNMKWCVSTCVSYPVYVN